MRAAAADDDAGFVADVLAMFREQEFYYTLTPPRLERDSVDDFLFNTRRGFCGHLRVVLHDAHAGRGQFPPASSAATRAATGTRSAAT
jgi:hypothetical protein